MGEEARQRRERESATMARRGCERLWGAAGVLVRALGGGRKLNVGLRARTEVLHLKPS